MRRRTLLSGDKKEKDYSQDYLTMVVTSGDSIQFNGGSLLYSKDNGNTWTTANSGRTISVVAGDKVLWKGTLTPQDFYGIGNFSGNARYLVKGNVMSLLFGDNFKGQTSLSGKNYALYGLFNNTNVTSAKNLSLPATTLANNCYARMFYACKSLTTVPELPATTLETNCYSYMFNSCTSLTTAPELSATTLANGCYQYMFQGCKSLTTAPELPATTLYTGCYRQMFMGCTSLVNAPALPATTLPSSCYDSMFYNCTSLTTAPELPATTLAYACYNLMFRYCSSLNYIKCLATNIMANSCTTNWVESVAASGTFTKAASMTSWTEGTSGIPSGWTVVDDTSM